MLHSYDDHAFCPSQKETANNVLEKLSAPKPLCGKWFPKDDTKQKANASYDRLFGTRTDTSQQRFLDWHLHINSIYLSRKDLLF